jgi:hypothetical protein
MDAAAVRRGNVFDSVAAEGRGGGIGTVRAFGHQNNLPRVAARLQGRTDRQQAAKLPVRPALGLIATECIPVSVTSQ